MSDNDDILLVFFQECDEQLQELERGLTVLTGTSDDLETINAVFRAVHSIKGGAASFGLDRLVKFAHIFESTLDGVRSGRLTPTPGVVDIFLKSMDVLSDLVEEAKGGNAVSEDKVSKEYGALHALAGDGPSVGESVIPDDFVPVAFDAFDFGEDGAVSDQQALIEAPLQAPATRLVVTVKPFGSLYDRGDDIRNLLIGLHDLTIIDPGSSEMAVSYSGALPELDDIQPEEGYLTWRIVMPSGITKDQIKEVFEWAIDDCSLNIAPLDNPSDSSPSDDSDDNPDGGTTDTPSASATESAVAACDVVSLMEPSRSADNAPSDKEESGSASPHALQPFASPVPPPHKKPPVVPQTIRVDLHRIDSLMDLAGELVIAQAALESITSELGSDPRAQAIAKCVSGVRSLTHDIQDSVMSVRAQPVGAVFQRMQRVVREAAGMTGKSINLILSGEDTEVDRTLVEKLSDPLTHMLRNAVDHGIESSDRRKEAGKPEVGTIRLSAEHRSGRILITIKDDGGGINQKKVREIAVARGIIASDAVLSEDDINNLIFAPGFSTADKVSDLSGRGVGMDVVKQAITSLGGRVTIASTPGEGTAFYLSLPLTLAILDGMLVRAGGEMMIIPVSSVIETIQLNPDRKDVYLLPDGSNVISIRGECIPVISLGEALGFYTSEAENIIMVVENESGSKAAMRVGYIKDQMQVVIKSMEKNYKPISGVSAVTILGDGSVSLILDIPTLISSGKSGFTL